MESVLTLDDLRKWRTEGVALAVVGYPIQHSLSPPMHNAALAAMSGADPRFQSWQYHRFEIRPEDLGEALTLFHRARFKGLNLTLPHKVQAVELVSYLDPEAEGMGAVNTLLWQEDGYHGFNSDGFGINRAVQYELGVELSNTPVVLLGAGGAARAVAVQCLISGCPQLLLWNRSEDRLLQLYELAQKVKQPQTSLSIHTGEVPYGKIPPTSLIINVTALGLKEGDPAPMEVALLPADVRVYDSTYGCLNALARECASRGVQYADGLSMLVWQGVKSLQIWSGATVPANIMMATARKMLQIG